METKEESEVTYLIWRSAIVPAEYFISADIHDKWIVDIIARDLTLEEAQALCVILNSNKESE